MGFFNKQGQGWKSASTPTEWLKEPHLSKVIEEYCGTGAVCGHTRGGTRGGRTTRNAHPFHYAVPGTNEKHFVILAHNGVVDAPKKYPVDSEYLADLLAHNDPGDYQKALGDVEGWFGLTWYDSRTEEIYLLNWECSLSFTTSADKKTVYYSSAEHHLMTATACERLRVTKDDGEVWAWDGKKLRQLKNLKGTKRKVVTRSYVYNAHDWDNFHSTEFSGTVVLMDDNKWYGCTKGRNYRPLKHQEDWHKLYPGAGRQFFGSRYVTPHHCKVKIEHDPEAGPDVNFEGKPVPPKKAEDDTVLEASEQGVVITETPGVSDNHALVKEDADKRFQEAEYYDEAQKKLLAELDDNDRKLRLEILGGKPVCPPCTIEQRRVLRQEEEDRMRLLGFGDEYIDESLWTRGYFGQADNQRSCLFSER